MKKHTSKLVAVKGASNHPTTPDPKPLTSDQQDTFEKLEDQISDNLLGGFRLAAALAQIRDERLYREHYNTFEEYCKKRWEYSRSYCERLADMHEVLTDLKEYEDNEVFPRNELQARVFVPLKKDQRIKLLKTVLAESKTDKTTATELAKYREQLWPDQFAAEPKPIKTKVAVIDVEARVISTPEIPSIIKTVDAAKELLDTLIDDECDDSALVNRLREFLKLSEPVVKWEKARLN